MKKVEIEVDPKIKIGEEHRSWRYIGYDECNYSYIPEGKALLRKFGELEDAPYFVRTHFMFCTGNCHGSYKFGSTNVYFEDEEGKAKYNFVYYDMIIDAFLETGNKPFVELGFMPKDLVDKSYLLGGKEEAWQSYAQYKEVGWTCPPKDYQKWHDFIYALMQHLVDRYGETEVKSWYFELWNEPDIFYWSGTTAEYCKLFDFTEHALHTVLPEARLSGPAVTGIFKEGHAQEFFRYFLSHCKEGVNYYSGEHGTRLDFITFHVKGGGFPFEINAKKAVPSVESLVFQVKMGLDIIREFGYENCELVLSEADPDGWAAGGIYDNANMRFRNTEYYASYVASTYDKIEKLSDKYKMKIRPLAWAFMFPGERCFEGTRTFSTQGIDKAVLNMFRIYAKLGTDRLWCRSSASKEIDFLDEPDIGIKNHSRYTGEGEATEVAAFAHRNAKGRLQLVIYSHNNDIDLKELQKVVVHIKNAETVSDTIRHLRIDGEHSNAYMAWVKEGKPLFPEEEQWLRIKQKDKLEAYRGETELKRLGNTIEISFEIPTHGISYIELGE